MRVTFNELGGIRAVYRLLYAYGHKISLGTLPTWLKKGRIPRTYYDAFRKIMDVHAKNFTYRREFLSCISAPFSPLNRNKILCPNIDLNKWVVSEGGVQAVATMINQLSGEEPGGADYMSYQRVHNWVKNGYIPARLKQNFIGFGIPDSAFRVLKELKEPTSDETTNQPTAKDLIG